MKKKTGIIIAVILVIVIFICIFAFGKNKENTNNEIINKNELVTNIEVNKQENEVIENEILNEEENTNLQDEKQNVVENTSNTETFEESPATAEEKAINIVKEDWKQTNNVKVTVEGMNESGKYIVVVRDSNTTEALAFYSVDVSNKTFTKREMN